MDFFAPPFLQPKISKPPKVFLAKLFDHPADVNHNTQFIIL